SVGGRETADEGARTDVPNLTNGEAIPKHPNHVKIPTGSLHDELRFQSPWKASITKPPSPLTPKKMPTATQSRPCYRCISFMHAAGIKRVFWTNKEGEWESAKVQHLVDSLEGPATPGNDIDGGVDSCALFVTKHEVLMLRRGMG
ncbi:MAG: hypothetical protein Q9164_001755, partial [Protoblastenia rupestris]